MLSHASTSSTPLSDVSGIRLAFCSGGPVVFVCRGVCGGGGGGAAGR